MGTSSVVIKQQEQFLAELITDEGTGETDQKAGADDHRKQLTGGFMIAAGMMIGKRGKQKVA